VPRERHAHHGLTCSTPRHPANLSCRDRDHDDEPGLLEDYRRWLEQLAPFDPSPERYLHNRTGEDNADAHHKRQIMGREVVVAITGGRLDFGPWEQIFYGEFDGKREKRVLIKIIGE
jgi:secondary thiamine-phosphate synthase enzyme